MSLDQTTLRFKNLASRMRAEWDRRVLHDYRYWMSDGIENDAHMWKVGERDFEVLTAGLPRAIMGSWVALELGCGVGRLLKSASQVFGQVIGVDVSASALQEAERLLEDQNNIQYVLGNGTDLHQIPDQSVDFVYSFAALSSMPASVFCAYLKEIHRIMKHDGLARLQLYLGREQETFEEDTIAIRSYSRDCFERTISNAGFSLECCEELKLPFEVSNQEAGLVAEIATLRKVSAVCSAAHLLEDQLLPGGERQAGASWGGSSTEYYMALARAQQHMNAGRAEAAKQALEYAVQHYKAVDADVTEILKDLEKKLGASPEKSNGKLNFGTTGSVATKTPSTLSSSPEQRPELNSTAAQNIQPKNYLEKNLSVIRLRFPQLVSDVLDATIPTSLEIRRNPQGCPIPFIKGLGLIHFDKPERAAQSWTEQALNSSRVKAAREIVIAGFGAVYHLEALLEKTQQPIHLFEPDAGLLRAMFEVRDCSTVLEKLASCSSRLLDLRMKLGEKLESDGVELIIYPQTQITSPDAVNELKRLLISARGLQQIHPRVGVVGPLYGGSLPIARYTARALQGLRQRNVGFDLSSFYKPFQDLGSFLKNPTRKGLIENDFIEMLSKTVLESITEKPVDILVCLAQAPLSPTMLTELRNRGIITVMWFVEDCARFDSWKHLSRYFDYMFLIQKGDWLKKVEEAGAGRAIYLPVGCDPDIHRPHTLSYEDQKKYGSDISFLGAGYNNRRHMFANLTNRDFKIWGTEWPACMPFTKLVQDNGRRIEPEEYVKIFNATKINLNLHSSMERDGVEPDGDFVNPRTFELAATGAFQLVDERTLMPDLFRVGEELAVFHDQKEMQDSIDYYLAHPEERQKFIVAARDRVLSEHSYQHRVKSMLEYIYADRFEQLKAKEQSGVWHTTLEAAKEFPELESRFRKAFERGDDPDLNALVQDIQTGKGSLSEEEQKLLFLHHIRSQIATVRTMRNEKDQ